ncbi:hypothetical protein [Aurantibacillus circumpalustris]|uniref:hypothetical protein n=1 Tax=Aurantibacillus circumpalustris TaxID=3036359 RepID=UPI00295B6384|nr:hypothetical protein [Aurantibacillus circumpalustris]
MKKITTLNCLLLLFFNYQSKAQLKLKQYLVAAPVMLVTGMIDGTIESINYHYEDGFKLTCPNANDQFWNPAVSWKNKYKNNDPAQGQKFIGSTNVFAFTTDAYHLLRTTNRTLTGVAMAYYINQSYREKELTKKKKWLKIGADFLILTAIRTVGFHFTYSLLFRKQ